MAAQRQPTVRCAKRATSGESVRITSVPPCVPLTITPSPQDRVRAASPQNAATTRESSLLDAVLVLDLLEDLGVLDVPGLGALFEVLDPVANLLVDRLVELHVRLADVLDLAAHARVVGDDLTRF